jgi:hypothetical protein
LEAVPAGIGPGTGIDKADGMLVHPSGFAGEVAMEDEERSITAIFWLILAFALFVLTISVGAAWAFLMWIDFLQSEELWPALLVLGIGVLGAIGSFAGIIAWVVKQARR